MLDTLFNGLYEATTTSVAITGLLTCLTASLLIGIFLSFVFSRMNRSSRSFSLTLALLPAIVCVIIMMVNGNVGTGVAVAGAFSLVRFRSAQGSAKEIGMLFLAMAAGLMTGMGYLGYAVVFVLILTIAMAVLTRTDIFTAKGPDPEKLLRITIPEDLNYEEVFDEVFDAYTDKHEMIQVKTTNMGSMYKLTYSIVLKDPQKAKSFIDDLRCRNGNLEISISQMEENANEL
ncbi:MAG TPA: DUF4956 domain-containing protein [Lachnospiraceae bacterium]|nr:DUF4956 domain-containing protein [Lachnospiraceae bacterium]